MLLTYFRISVLPLLAGLLITLVLSASALADPDASYVLGPGSPNQTVTLAWPDGESLSVTLRVVDAKPSYVPASVRPGTGASYTVAAWGSNPRTITFSHPDHADDIVVEWRYDPDHVGSVPPEPIDPSDPDASYVLGPGSPNQQVNLQWPDGEEVAVTLRVHDALPSYLPSSVDPGSGGSYVVEAWGSNPRTITFSHPAHADDIVVQWSYDPNYAPQNRAPTVTGVLEAQTVTIGRGTWFLAASAFTDPDGDALVYSAESDTPAVATAMIGEGAVIADDNGAAGQPSASSIVIVEGVTAGVATVTVTAQDPAGEAASVAVAVTVVEESVTADLLVDTNRDGRVNAADEEGEEVWTSASGAVFGPNQDDDDADGVRDWQDEEVNGEADLLDMAPIVVRRIPGLTEQQSVVLEMDFESTSATPRLFLQQAEGSFEVLLHRGSRRALLPAAMLKAGDVQLFLEISLGRARGFDGNLSLVLEIEENGEVVAQDQVALRGSPVLLSHHLQPAERLFVANITSDSDNNQAFVGALKTGLPDYVDLYYVGGAWDRWIQDIMQTAYVQRPSLDGVKTDVVHMNLRRGGELESFLPDDYLGPDTGYVFPAGQDIRYSLLSAGGNLEVIPPHTHDGQNYPFGRIVIGGSMDPDQPKRQMARKQIEFLEAQEVQGPIVEVPSDWLSVGHIDEIFLVVPKLNAGLGGRPWAIVIASPSLAVATLQEAQGSGHGNAAVFEGRPGHETTIDDLLSDSFLMDRNDYYQGVIDTVRETLKSEIGLTDADFHEVPVLYEGRSSRTVALVPAVQNLVVGDTVLFVPDPEGPDVDGVDIWQQATREALGGLGLDLQFVDVFYSYHAMHGEAHCGANVERKGVTETPWWTAPGRIGAVVDFDDEVYGTSVER